MKYLTCIFATAFFLLSVDAFAAGYTCKTIQGTINQLNPEFGQCTITNGQAQSGNFPDIDFIYPDSLPFLPNTCFSTTLQGTFGNTVISGRAYSGLIRYGHLNIPITDQLNAASTIILYTGNSEFGRMNTTDVIYNPFDFNPIPADNTTRELLTMVSGTKRLKDARGNLTIVGNLLQGPAPFFGTLCLAN